MEIEEATVWDHPAVLSILRFKVPILLLLRLVSRVSCRLTAEGLNKNCTGSLSRNIPLARCHVLKDHDVQLRPRTNEKTTDKKGYGHERLGMHYSVFSVVTSCMSSGSIKLYLYLVDLGSQLLNLHSMTSNCTMDPVQYL